VKFISVKRDDIFINAMIEKTRAVLQAVLDFFFTKITRNIYLNTNSSADREI